MAPRPRRRPRKNVGNTRFDAALDAMRPYEFPPQLVRKTIDQLLEVYGGNEGWPFIEEASYSVLLEAILEKQNSSVEEEKKDLLQGNATKEGFAETSSNAMLTATTAITEASSSNPVHRELEINEGLDSASQTNDVQDSAWLGIGSAETGGEDSTMGAEKGGNGQYLRVESRNVNDNAIQSWRRKPCYGWISDDKDSDHARDLIRLPPAPLPKELKMLLNQLENSSKPLIHKKGPRSRKSRWDEKPEGM
ncbi:hypothetical protein L6164_032892 [Bauhinia variegata]|uniref:Uncharacterized protein n=1 Tax=Bauhinia variegata TaxID=167791 RepID=A0ACB9KQ96_BAUVA|nr:hypothetical protein L6164_032892 [Bauhinia variegata]